MSNQQYVRQYNSFRGVDFTSDPVNVADYRLQYAVNMWRDYENNNGNMIETVPGFRKIGKESLPEFGDFINESKSNGMHYYRTTDHKGNLVDYVISHEGCALIYKRVDSDEPFRAMYSGNLPYFMANHKSESVLTNNKLYMVDGSNIIAIEPSTEIDDDGKTVDILIAKTFTPVTLKAENAGGVSKEETSVSLAKYIPTTYKDGEKYEAPNLLNTLVKEVFNNTVAPEIEGGEGDEGANPPCATFYLKGIKSIEKVTLGKKEIKPRETDTGYVFHKGGRLDIYGYGADAYTNVLLSVEGYIDELHFQDSSKYPSFTIRESRENAKNIICGCTSICVFDGKVFLTSNPKHPNMVFWTATDLSGNNNVTYIGIFNFLYTGVGMTPNKDMIASNGVLMVFKGDTVQDGSVYYLTGFDVNVEDHEYLTRYYAVTEGAAGIGCIGGACNFMDDAVFISKRGLDAVGKQLTNLERSIVHRSTMVDRKLLAEDLSQAEIVEWKGYLVISINGHIYLADSRAMYTDETGNAQYEWFYLEGIGGYLIKDEVYRYWSGALPEGCPETITTKPESNEEIVEGTVNKNGEFYYEESTGYLCYNDGEYKAKDGAKFYPAKNLVVINDILFFSADNGAVYCFNTDKRGEIPEGVILDDDETDEEYDSKSDFVGRIPQEYYSFDGIRYPSGIITKTDNANAPYALKNTINRSLVLRCGADPRTHSTVTVEVLTDRTGRFDIVDKKDTVERNDYALDMGALSYDAYPFAFLTFREHERKWIEKKYKIYNDAFRGILRLHSLSYRYEIGGNIK